MKKNLIRFLLLGVASMCAPLAAADSYDPSTNRLTIDSIQVGGTVYTGVVVTVGSVISVGGSKQVASSVSATCTAANITTASFNAIQEGMSVEQVNQVMGCQYTPALTLKGPTFVVYSWAIPSTTTYITVWFDSSGSKVTRLGGSASSFKDSHGI